jgi:predicted phosphodiesterase
VRVALIADVHANLPALQAVLAHVDTRRADVVYHLGDLVGYAPWPNETVALIEQRRIVGVSGNYDSTVATDYQHCGCKYEDPQQEALSHVSYAWTREQVTPATKAFLGALPFRLDVRPFGGHAPGPRLVLVHGTPTLNTLYWTADRSDAFCTQMAALAGMGPGDLIAFGHTHIPWHRTVNGIHFINAGSVGRPKDGDPRASYAELTFNADGGVGIEVHRVTYDVIAAARGIRESTLPDAFAAFLELGGTAVVR